MLGTWRTMLRDDYGGALSRGFRFAHELGVTCGPVHFLVGVAEGDGPAAHALSGSERSLRDVVITERATLGQGSMHLNGQVQGAARLFAEQLGMAPAAEHLLVAVLDQGAPQILAVLAMAGIDPGAARTAALAGLGIDTDLPPIAMPPLTPAGTFDRPPLPIADLDARAWAVLSWRQDHLPLHRLRGVSSWHGLWSVEYQIAWRLPGRLGLDDDQRYSLLSQHLSAVEERLTAARPDLAPARVEPSSALQWRQATRRLRLYRRLRFLSFAVGWPSWFGNRRAGIRQRWFWLTTLRHYRHQPLP
jgi:Clp amino terminal domain, pathogenicity island component